MTHPDLLALNELSRTQQLIQANIDTVRFCVNKLRKQCSAVMSYDEMITAGIRGLIEADAKFEASRGAAFKTFAEYRIRGAILDEIRQTDWFSRNTLNKQQQLDEASQILRQRLGRDPEDVELAAYLDMPLEDFFDAFAAIRTACVVSLHEVLSGSFDESDTSFIDLLADPTNTTPESILLEKDIRQVFVEALTRLSSNEKNVLSLIYFDELSQKEVSLVMQLSEGRVSQIHAAALVHLKRLVQDELS